DSLEERRVKLQRLGDDFAIREEAGVEHLDPGERRDGVQDVQSGVFEIAAGAEPLVRLVQRRQSSGGGIEKRDLYVALADDVELPAQGGDSLIVRVEQAALGQERMNKPIADGAFNEFAKLSARHEQCVYVDSVGVQRESLLG